MQSGRHIQEIAAGLRAPQGLALADGRLFVCEAGRGRVCAVDLATGALEPVWEGLTMPSGVAAAGAVLYVASAGKHAVYARDLRCQEAPRVVAGVEGQSCNMKHGACGDGGPATAARLFSPQALALGSAGELSRRGQPESLRIRLRTFLATLR